MPSKSLRDLNHGWPFSEHPMAAPIRFEVRTGICPNPDTQDDGAILCGCENRLTCVAYTARNSVYVVCGSCPQAIWNVSEGCNNATDPEHPQSLTIDLTTLKARIVDHWLKCHEDEIAGETYW